MPQFKTLACIVTMWASASAFALEDLSSATLRDSCQSANADETSACQFYLQGFIDGAVSTDPSVANNVARESSNLDRITERAMRTRVRNRLETYGPSYYAGFCLPDSLLLAELRDRFLQHPESTDLARNALYEVVRKDFPCAEPKAATQP